MPSLWPNPAEGYRSLADGASDGALHTLVRRASKLDPTHDQRTIIIVACVYAAVIALLW